MITPKAGYIVDPSNPNAVIPDPSAPVGVGGGPTVTPNPSGSLANTMNTPAIVPTTPQVPASTGAQPQSPAPQTTAATAPGAGLDPSSFMNVLNGVKQNFSDNNQLINAKNLLLKGIFTSPLTPDQVSQLPPDIQQVYNGGNKDAILLQVQALNERIQGGTTNYANSINYLVNGYKTSVDDAQKKRQDAVETLIKLSQNFVDPATGKINNEKMSSALSALYPGVDISGIVSELNGMTPTSAYNSQLHYGGSGEDNFTVSIPPNTIAGQTNNPLNIKFVAGNNLGGADSGIQAKDGGTFAAFQSPTEGLNAAIKLLQSPGYANLTLDAAMKRWSNSGYGAEVAPSLNAKQKMSSLSDEQLTQLVNDMAKRESGASIEEVPTDSQIQAKSLVDGSLIPSLISAYGGARNKAIANAKRIDPNYDVTKAELDYQSSKRWASTMNSPQMVKFQGLAVSVVNTINDVKDLSQQLKNSGIPVLNSAKLALLAQTAGNTKEGQLAARYMTAVNTLKEEFANLANGGYAPTESAWALANSQINGNFGVDQLGASLSEVQRLINYRLNAIGSTQPVTVGGGQFGQPPTTSTPSNDPLGLGI